MSPMEQLAKQEYERGYSDGKSDYFAAGVAEGEMRARQRMIANRVLDNQHPFAASGKLITKQDHIANVGKVINADRELLELAAKAACYEVYWHHANQCYMIVEGSSERKWKPLSNGHDSLQLAAKLLMNVEINKASVIVCLPPLESGFTPPPIFEYPVSDYDEDFNVNYFRHYEATCLAILRAAAEIGKELP